MSTLAGFEPPKGYGLRVESTVRKILLGGTATAASIAAVVVAEKRIIRGWQHNPDPLDGRPVHFTGTETIVATDDGAKISTRSTGSGDDVIVMVHGVTGNHDDWGPIAERLLTAGRRVITVDQRGHGDSTVGGEGYGALRLGRDLAHVFEQLDLRDVTLVGHSMGGMAALALAVDRPDIVKSRLAHLVPIATTATMAGGRYQTALWLGGFPVLESLKFLDRRMELAAGLAAFGKKPSLFMVQESVRSFRRCPDEVRRKATVALRNLDLIDALETIHVPTTVVCGTHDFMTPLAGNEAIAERIPGATLQVFDGAGHMIIWERADEIAQIVL